MPDNLTSTTGTAASGLGTQGGTSTSGLAPWVQGYITDYLAKAQALANQGYQVYQGPQTAGIAPLQQAAFRGIANLAVPQALMQAPEYLNQIAQNLGNVGYQPVGVSFTGKDIPARANMPLVQNPVTMLQQGTLGAPIGTGEYLPWGGFQQRVVYDGTGVSTGTGTSISTGTGTGTGTSISTGTGTGTGTSISTGTGTSISTGTGTGTGTGTSTGTDTGTGTGTGTSTSVSTGTSTGTGVVYPSNQDPTVSPTPGTSVDTKAIDIANLNDLYQKYFGHAGDAEGMKYWQNKFGKEIDNKELQEFLTAGLGVIQDQGGEASTELLDTLRGMGLNPNQQSRIADSTKKNITDLYQQYLGRAPENEGLHYWASRFGKDVSNDELLQFLQSAQTVLQGQNKAVPQTITDKIRELTTGAAKTSGASTTAVNPPALTGDSRQDQINQQKFQESSALAAVKGDTKAADTSKGTQVENIYKQLGRWGNLAPSDAEIAYWASQNKSIDQIKQEIVNAAAGFVNDPVYGEVGKTAKRILDQGLMDQLKTNLARGGIAAYADGGTVSPGVTTDTGIASLKPATQNTAYNTPAATGSAPTALSNVNAATPIATGDVSSYAQQYMNPYLQASLAPQYEELRRQAQINLQPSLAKLSQAGGLGGGRQAIMESEAQRNLLQAQQNLLGQGYNTAFNQAQQQFNTEQQRAIQEAQFGADYGLRAAQQQAQAAQAMGQLGLSQNQAQLANLGLALTGGGTQRDITQQGITADYNEFLKQLQYPYQQLQFQQGMLSGLPVGSVTNTPTQLSGVASLITAMGGLDKLLAATGQKDLTGLLNNLFGGTIGS